MDIKHYLNLADQIRDLQYQLISKAEEQDSAVARDKTLRLVSLTSQLSEGVLLASADKQPELPDGFAEAVDEAARELKVVKADIAGKDHDLSAAIARTHRALDKTIGILEVVGRWPLNPPPSDDEQDSSSKEKKT